MSAMGASRAVKSLGRPRFRDVVAGLVTGLFSIPEGMAYASIGGFNPVAGLYSGVVSTIVGSVLARTVLMVTTLDQRIGVVVAQRADRRRPGSRGPGQCRCAGIVVGW